MRRGGPLEGRADFAVHSAKDLPADLPRASSGRLPAGGPQRRLHRRPRVALGGLREGQGRNGLLRRQIQLRAARPTRLRRRRAGTSTRLRKPRRARPPARARWRPAAWGWRHPARGDLDRDRRPGARQGSLAVECRADCADVLAALAPTFARTRAWRRSSAAPAQGRQAAPRRWAFGRARGPEVAVSASGGRPARARSAPRARRAAARRAVGPGRLPWPTASRTVPESPRRARVSGLPNLRLGRYALGLLPPRRSRGRGPRGRRGPRRRRRRQLLALLRRPARVGLFGEDRAARLAGVEAPPRRAVVCHPGRSGRRPCAADYAGAGHRPPAGRPQAPEPPRLAALGYTRVDFVEKPGSSLPAARW